MAGRKNQYKVEWHHLPKEALEVVAMVFMMGARKYGTKNWQCPPYFTRDVLTDCQERHAAAVARGQLFDEESQLFHSAHKACNALMEVYYDVRGLFVEDDLLDDEANIRMQEMRERWKQTLAAMDAKNRKEDR